MCPNESIKEWEHPRFFGRVAATQKDVAVVVSFKHFLPPSLIQKFPAASLNIHPSLLPKYRGASPIQHALLNGDSQTGISIIDLDPGKFDAGRVYYQEPVDIPRGSTYAELFDLLAHRGADALLKVLRSLDEYSAKSWSQDASKITTAPKIRKEDALITFDMPVMEIWRKHAAFGHQQPIYFETKSGACQIRGLFNQEADPTQESLPPEDRLASLDPANNLPIGTTVHRAKKDCNVIWIKCSDGWIGATAFHMESRKKTSSAIEFRNGHLKGNGNLLHM